MRASGKNLYGTASEKPESVEAEYYIRRQRALLSTLINGYCVLHSSPQKRQVAVALRLLHRRKLHPVGGEFLTKSNTSG